jgi:hypothetical protein
MSITETSHPVYAEERHNVRLLGQADLGGHGATMELIARGNYLYVGHSELGVGVSILDVSNPRDPRLVHRIPVPPDVLGHKIQICGDVLVVGHEAKPGMPAQKTGIAVFRLDNPAEPRQMGFLQTAGFGPHRMYFVDGHYLYTSVKLDGWTDRILMIVDMSDPSNPREASRWWIPGQWTAGGENQFWSSAGLRVMIHHGLTIGNKLYMGMWDHGLGVLDVSDKEKPFLSSQLQWVNGRRAHTCLPLPDRRLLIQSDEAKDGEGFPTYVRVIDIQDDHNPRILSRFPMPQGDYASRGDRHGPHNLHENYPGSYISDRYIFVTYFAAGLRIVDVADPIAPKEVAYYVPATPPAQKAAQTNDVFVDSRGIIYTSDRRTAGVHILEWQG